MADKQDENKDKGTQEPPKAEPISVSKEEFEGLKSKIGELGKYIDDTKEFIDGASVVINTLAFTPELKDKFQEVLKKQVGGQGVGQQQEEDDKKKNPTGSNQPPSTTDYKVLETKVDDMAKSDRAKIIDDFERQYGINSLKQEDRKQVRQAVEGYLNEFGESVNTAPLTVLRSHLDKAYVGIHADKLREEGKLEGIAQYRQNQQGMVGFGGGAPQSQGEEDLSPAQKEWADKLGVDASKAKETYLKQDSEKTRIPASEKKQ